MADVRLEHEVGPPVGLAEVFVQPDAVGLLGSALSRRGSGCMNHPRRGISRGGGWFYFQPGSCGVWVRARFISKKDEKAAMALKAS